MLCRHTAAVNRQVYGEGAHRFADTVELNEIGPSERERRLVELNGIEPSTS